MTPTRELAIQVADQARALAKYTDLKIITITGGISYQEHAEILGKTQDIVVATPGRLMEYVEAERFDCRAIESLVLDEADRMLDMGFGAAVDRLSAECRWRKQSMLFSATLEGKGIEGFKSALLTDPVEVEAEPPRRERKKITQWYYRCDDMAHKNALLKSILAEQAERAIIFVKTRERLAELREYLTKEKVKCAWLQGEMPQAKRTYALNVSPPVKSMFCWRQTLQPAVSTCRISTTSSTSTCHVRLTFTCTALAVLPAQVKKVTRFPWWKRTTSQ